MNLNVILWKKSTRKGFFLSPSALVEEVAFVAILVEPTDFPPFPAVFETDAECGATIVSLVLVIDAVVIGPLIVIGAELGFLSSPSDSMSSRNGRDEIANDVTVDKVFMLVVGYSMVEDPDEADVARIDFAGGGDTGGSPCLRRLMKSNLRAGLSATQVSKKGLKGAE